MTPKTAISPEIFKSFEFKSTPSKTYKIDFEQNRIIGMADEVEAVEQAIYFILRTERYKYIIYSRDYGIELEDLYGKQKQYVIPQLGKRILDALMQDDRITSVSGFSFSCEQNKYTVKFTVGTVYGNDISINDKVVV
ncbi:MAG: DUF2634 domain-containing protein [Monoglobus pectinilyticus]|uniref:DUF2634 domain-containing protein n=1 Tax=Monoglobus pectinilyticus TaxID=1981510 RepID=UPI003996B8F3